MQVKKTVLLVSCLPFFLLSACDKPNTEEKPTEKKAVEVHHVEVNQEAVGTEEAETETSPAPEATAAQQAGETAPTEAEPPLPGVPEAEEQVLLPPEENPTDDDVLAPASDQEQGSEELIDAAEQSSLEQGNAQVQEPAPDTPEQAEPAQEEESH
jgi:hypothetical protein